MSPLLFLMGGYFVPKLRRRFLFSFMTVLLVLGLVTGSAGAATNRDQVFTNIRTIFEVVEAYHKNGADLQKFFEGAVRGGLEALGDRHTNYFSPPEFSSFMESLEGNITGIGIYLELSGNYVVVAAPIKGSPAYEAGLQTGDRIVEVNGTSLVGGTIEKAQQLIRGDAGAEVVLKIERPSEGRVFEVKIVRAVIHIPQVEYELLDGGIGYLALINFGSTADSEFYAAVKGLKEQGATSLVLDLRQNPGGYVSAAVSIASAFVPAGSPVLYEVGRNGESVLKSSGKLINLPTVVLVDGGSASASEILAGAIQDYGAAKLVGTKTFGKGTVQQILFMHDGSGLKVTIAEYLTGKRRHVDGQGLTPDYVVEPSKLDSSLNKPMSLTRLLLRNSVGMDVLDLQNRLLILGYETEVDGTFGSKTHSAVSHFRYAQGLSGTTSVDNAFAEKLNEQVAKKLAEQAKQDVQLEKAIELLTTKH